MFEGLARAGVLVEKEIKGIQAVKDNAPCWEQDSICKMP